MDESELKDKIINLQRENQTLRLQRDELHKLKPFVWEDVLCDYTCGVMFALAHDVEEARALILDQSNYVGDELDQEPREVTTPTGFVVWGGG